MLERVLERSGYLDSLRAERTIEAQGRVENFQELVGVAQEYQTTSPEPSLSGFLQEISLYSDQDAIRGEQSLVTLMTLHNAKGLEFRASTTRRWKESPNAPSARFDRAGNGERSSLTETSAPDETPPGEGMQSRSDGYPPAVTTDSEGRHRRGTSALSLAESVLAKVLLRRGKK